MLHGLTPEPAQQQRAFAVNFTAQNMALGIGAAVAAVVVSAHHPGTFQVLFLANGLSCLLFASLLPALPNLRRTRVVNEARAGYRDVLSHRGLRLMILAALLLAFAGPATFDSGLPAFASVADHISDHAIAVSFTINTVVIVAIQMLVLRLVRRHRRSSGLVAVGLIWAASWTLLGFAEAVDGPGWRIAILFAFTGLFGVGETFVAPTRAPLINSLADDRIRGRANSITGFANSVMLIRLPCHGHQPACGAPRSGIDRAAQPCLPRHRRYRRQAARDPHRRAGFRHAASRGRVAARADCRSTYCGARERKPPTADGVTVIVGTLMPRESLGGKSRPIRALQISAGYRVSTNSCDADVGNGRGTNVFDTAVIVRTEAEIVEESFATTEQHGHKCEMHLID